MSEIIICPKCGTRSDEVIDSMFSGKQWAIRKHKGFLYKPQTLQYHPSKTQFYECRKCGHRWSK